MYVCPTHRRELQRSGSAAVCPGCADPYVIQDGIWLLDRVQRPDRLAFDEQATADTVRHDTSRAAAHLEAAKIDRLSNSRILDAGCGLGDLANGLARLPGIGHCEIYGFDHSLESLRRAAQSSAPLNGNFVRYSAQDASALYFREQSFELVLGSAFLHHLTDYKAFLHEVSRVLTDDGVAVFSEPFFNGYLWPSVFLGNAIHEAGVHETDPELGLSNFIIDLVSFMARHEDDPAALADLTDKSFFSVDAIIGAARDAGFQSVNLRNVAARDFYASWMQHFLDTYQVKNDRVRDSAMRQYSLLAAIAGPKLPEIVGHFKYIVLSK